MEIRETAQKGRRTRRPNGEPRSDSSWAVRGVEDGTKVRINYLAGELGTTNGAIIELATKFLLQSLNDQDINEGRKRNTFSQTFSIYSALLGEDDQPSDDPAVIELEKRLQERREARDKLMDRKSVIHSPDPSEDDEGA